MKSYRTAGMMGTAWIGFQAWTIRRMDALAVRRSLGRGLPAHLATGERGEREALFHLRKMGYTVVARRWRNAKLWGDIDVKTRSGRDGKAAESAVDREKLDMLRRIARAYLRGFPEKLREEVPVRFD